MGYDSGTNVPATAADHAVNQELFELREQVKALEQLLEVYEQDTLEKSARLEQALAEVKAHAKQLTQSEARYRQLAERQEWLNRLVNQIRQSLELDTVLDTAVTGIRQLLQIDRCLFWWYCPATETFALVCEAMGGGGERSPHQVLASKPDVAGAVSHLATTDVLPCRALPYRQATLLQATFAGYVQLLIPIQTRNGRIGLIHCLHQSASRDWMFDEVELLQNIASQVAVGLDQAELYEQSCTARAEAQAQATALEQALAEIRQTPQLIQAEKMASLGQLVAGVAHEINNPVSFIQGNLLYASQYVDDLVDLMRLYATEYPTPTATIRRKSMGIDVDFLIEDLPKLFTSMQAGAERICEIVRSLRTFSRLDEAAVKSVNIHDGVESTLMLLQSRLKSTTEQAAIQVVKHYADLPLVQCHAGQLNQVFMHILANAIDALDESGYRDRAANRVPTIEIATSLKYLTASHSEDFCPLDGTSVVIRIKDNGPGIPVAVQQRLFDPFFTTKPVGKGTGLGMSISYQIITEMHGGRIQCFSAPGQGTEFAVEIPLQPVPTT